MNDADETDRVQVVQDTEPFERQQKTLLLKILAQGERDYQTGRTLTHNQAQTHLKHVLSNLPY